jgi:nucleoid DNA-binding protein
MRENDSQSNELPRDIEEHLRKLAASLSPEGSDEFYERLYRAWIEKERLFSEQTALLDMEPTQEISAEDERGMLVFTNSGSLLGISPAREGGRWIEYASIPLRADVPEIVGGNGVSLPSGVTRGEPLELANAPVKKSSPVYCIAVCGAGTPTDEQEKRIREGTIFLTNGFVRINKNAAAPDAGGVEHFTKATMVSYIAKRNGLTQKTVRHVIDDYHSMIESGMLLGEKVSLGNLGRMGLRVRAAQKARVGRNPATGEEMTIPAKPRHPVPKMSFSSSIRERAAQIDPDEIESAGSSEDEETEEGEES